MALPLPWHRRRSVAAGGGGADVLRETVRRHLAPALTRAGLRGSGSAWRLPCDTHWVLVGLEQRAEPTRSVHTRPLSFVPRLAVVDRAAWQAARQRWLLPEVPPATVASGVGWEHRLPELVPGLPSTHWWTARPGEDVRTLAGSVVEPLLQHGLPALRAQLDLERAQRPCCGSASCGGEDCDRPADLAVRAPRQRLFLCARHASDGPPREVLGRWPDLLAG